MARSGARLGVGHGGSTLVRADEVRVGDMVIAANGEVAFIVCEVHKPGERVTLVDNRSYFHPVGRRDDHVLIKSRR